MIPELAHFALILALGLAALMATVPLVGVASNKVLWMRASRSLAVGFFVFIALAFACLAYSFLIDDFSVQYVAQNSNTLLPDRYKFSAVWGGHEGSLLLWILILATWTLLVATFSRNLPLDMLARVLSVMGMIAVGFLLFMLLTSNPFDRLLPNVPTEGSDLNPLLQDFGLIIHPPMLYMGYVGFSVAFAFAIAALMSGRLDSAWARWSRPWTNTAWAFLTIGIGLGSWWAYYELGWGGWWFWDPVENASLMPWLVGTALIHSLAATEKRGVFKSWTILLAIIAFSLSLLGTFLVRSGVLTSVHAFANDPERGVFILGFLLFVVGGSLTLYALRAPVVKSVVKFNWLSRESFLLANNVLLMIVMATVLLGTLYPLFADALGWGKISVGPPYFNFFFVPLMGLICVLIAVAPMVNWKRSKAQDLVKQLWLPLGLAISTAVIFPWLYHENYKWTAGVAVLISVWLIAGNKMDLWYRLRHAKTPLQGLLKLTPSYYGMLLAHFGMGLCALAACLATIYTDQRDLRMEPGKSVDIGGYRFELREINRLAGPNYMADEGLIDVYKDGELEAQLRPQKRRYKSGGNIMTEAAIDPGLFRDLYVALGEPLNNGAWSVRVHFKPFVRLIWLGAIMMALGGILAVSDKRYRKRKTAEQKASVALGDTNATV